MITAENKILHNVKLKSYPLAGLQKMTVCNKAIFREPGWENIYDKPKPIKEDTFLMMQMARYGFHRTDEDIPDEWKTPGQDTEKPESKAGESRKDNTRRAKQKVFELALLNQFTHFITWTLDKEKIDRYDPKEISKKLKNFLRNQAKRNNLKYIIIPEYHKDGAIHMHGLISGNLEMVDSGLVTKRGQTVYNMPQWSYGFSTAIELDGNVLAIANYITKYITKDSQKIFGNYYYAGGGVVREAPTELLDTDYYAIESKEYNVPLASLKFKYLDLDFDRPEDNYPDDQFDIA